MHNVSSTSEIVLEEMKSELSALMGRAGFQIEWPGAQTPTRAVSGDLVVVELRGSCETPSASVRDSKIVQMGSSAVADGKVLPFSWVDCTAVVQLLEPHLTHKQVAQREFVYGRAMARVLAHEFYHILGRTLAHTATGLTKARLQSSDLLNEHAEYGDVAMSRSQGSARPSLLIRAITHP